MIPQENNAGKILQKMYSIFHKSTNSENDGLLAERLIATVSRFGLKIKPYENGNLKDEMELCRLQTVRILQVPLQPQDENIQVLLLCEWNT